MRLFEIISPVHDPKFLKWFGDSKVKDAKGNPRLMFHGTREKFSEFHPLSHFGTPLAANHRLDDTGDEENAHIKPVYLRIENPLRVTDQEASDEATLINAIAAGKYKMLDVNTARRQGIRKALLYAGYDGLVYRNRMEDRGKDSWVILEPDQVRSAF